MVWMDPTDDKSTLVQVIACRQATNYHLNHCWLRSMTPYGVTRPQLVNSERLHKLQTRHFTMGSFCWTCELSKYKPYTWLGFQSSPCLLINGHHFNTLRPRQNGSHVADDIFKRIFLNENVRIFIWISLKFVPKGPINNIPALARIMAWCRPGDKPLSEPMIIRLPTHICVTRPQWVKC